ncbi:MAG: hypothetical protein Q8O48_02415 [Anaerolineales bacterium]|nr:hypothetical protein [Anaerolineales bacterium]
MSSEEQERLKQLRDRQLQARDPLARQRNFQHNSSTKEKRMRKPFSLSKAWKDIPHIFKSPFYGLLLGVSVVFVLPTIWDSPYAIIVGAGVTLLFIVFGLILGNSLDIRDRIRDNLK